jgi:AcrR family transcriptional regulator
MARQYDMSKRSQQAQQTTEKIISATEELLKELPLSEINLNAIASKSDITVQTVLRHMESRDGCIKAVARRVAERIEKQRQMGNPGRTGEAVRNLVEHYEAEGDLVLNLLAQENEDPAVAEFTNQGREYHRRWVRHSFFLNSYQPSRELMDAMVAATDIYTWKLIRLDMGRSKVETTNVIQCTVHKLLEAS